MNGLQPRRRRRPELNLVPLIDVLVMLVFFAFVTMQFRSPGT
jgi:biopolymer transport protein ExbD